MLFILRFLDMMGYLPGLDCCGRCRRSLGGDVRWYWRTRRGDLTCSQHTEIEDECLALDLGTLMLIRQCRTIDLNKLWRLRIRQEAKGPLLQALLDWVRSHIHKDLKSLKLLRQIQWA